MRRKSTQLILPKWEVSPLNPVWDVCWLGFLTGLECTCMSTCLSPHTTILQFVTFAPTPCAVVVRPGVIQGRAMLHQASLGLKASDAYMTDSFIVTPCVTLKQVLFKVSTQMCHWQVIAWPLLFPFHAVCIVGSLIKHTTSLSSASLGSKNDNSWISWRSPCGSATPVCPRTWLKTSPRRLASCYGMGGSVCTRTSWLRIVLFFSGSLFDSMDFSAFDVCDCLLNKHETGGRLCVDFRHVSRIRWELVRLRKCDPSAWHRLEFCLHPKVWLSLTFICLKTKHGRPHWRLSGLGWPDLLFVQVWKTSS